MADLRAPRAPKAPRLRLRPHRSERSLLVEARAPVADEVLGEGQIPRISWKEFVRKWEWKQGEHITCVGTTGSGKTTLSVELLKGVSNKAKREFIIALATKARDKSLYPNLEKAGFVVTANPNIENAEDTPKIIFRPRLAAPTEAAREQQKAAFGTLLINVFNEGGWCLYGDEIRYLSDNLKLKTELETLWLQGRSLGVSIVVTTQRPVSIPVIAWEAATHLFLFRMTDRQNINRAAEFSSANVDLLRYWLPRLNKYEVIYIDTREGTMYRTKVEL